MYFKTQLFPQIGSTLQDCAIASRSDKHVTMCMNMSVVAVLATL